MLQLDTVGLSQGAEQSKATHTNYGAAPPLGRGLFWADLAIVPNASPKQASFSCALCQRARHSFVCPRRHGEDAPGSPADIDLASFLN